MNLRAPTRDIFATTNILATRAHLKTLSEGEYTTVLGVPFWEGPESDFFWEKLYAKLKKKVAAWKGVQNLSIHGRTLLVNFIIYLPGTGSPLKRELTGKGERGC